MSHIIKIQDAFSFIPRKELNLLEALESRVQLNIDQVEYQCIVRHVSHHQDSGCFQLHSP